MIRDRGTKKWTAMMLPEHVQSLKDLLIDEKKVKKPEIDEQALEEFELLICEAIESNRPLEFKLFDRGFTETVIGTVHFINHLKSQLIIQDEEGYFHHLPFANLINVHQE